VVVVVVGCVKWGFEVVKMALKKACLVLMDL